MEEMKRPFVQVYCSEELKEKIKAEAKRYGIPVAALIRLKLEGVKFDEKVD